MSKPDVSARSVVISVRGKSPDDFRTDPDSDFVYVGRNVQWTEWKKSFWANPFTVGKYGRDEAVRRFVDWLHETPDGRLRLDRIHELRGKTLGCWCVNWNGEGEPENPCHAVILAKLANALDPPAWSVEAEEVAHDE